MIKKYDKNIARITGSFIISGFHSKKADKKFEEFVCRYNFLGIIFFYRNIESFSQVRTLCEKAQRISLKNIGMPLIICVDQEGGYVGRFRKREILYPSPMALNASNSKKYLHSAGYFPNLFLRWMGFNTNLGPVLDVYTNPLNPSLGPRSFAGDPASVVKSSREWIKGAKKTGMLLTAKHFPGKGRSKKDSHLDLPKVKAIKKNILNYDLIPFKDAVKNGIDMVMTSHAWYTCFEKRKKPATLSKKINTDLLRKIMKFKGLLLTDDIEMQAIGKNYSVGEAAVKAIKSGADAVLVCKSKKNIHNVFDAIYKSIVNGEICLDLIEKSMKRKNIIRNRILRMMKKTIDDDLFKRERKRSIDIQKKESHKVITVIKGRNNIPFKKEEKILAVIPFKHPRILVEDRKNELIDFKKLLEKKGYNKRIRFILYKSIGQLKRKIEKSDKNNLILLLTNDLFNDKLQKDAFDYISLKFNKVTGVIVKNPVDKRYLLKKCAVLIATYCFTYDVQSALVDVLLEKNGKGKISKVLKKTKQ